MKPKKKYTPVRFSHLTSHAGVGAIVRDVNDLLVSVVDIRYWTDKSDNVSAEFIPYVTRVTQSLDLTKELRMPPKAKELENGGLEGSYLPTVLFPTYAVCRECGLLHNNPWRKQDQPFSEKVVCEKCNRNLEQITMCAASKHGYLDDVPWHYICHDANSSCKVDYSESYLRLTHNKNGKKIVECSRCNSWKPYDNLKIGVIGKQQPWVYETVEGVETGDVEILEVNNPGVYLPERVNALVIPPESRMSKNTVVDRLFNNSKLCRELETIRMPLRKKGKIKTVATQYRCSVEEIKEALKQINEGYPFLDNMTVGDLLEDEYKAFLTPIDNVRDDEDFVTDHRTTEWHGLENKLTGDLLSMIKLVDQLVITKRLREIQIFKGFYRISQDDKDKTNLVPPDIVGESNWLPAIELFGEGVFFTLNEEIFSDWEGIAGVRARADEIATRYEESEVTLFQDIVITPRFLLLHTLSHLLIRELESTAGYPSASLKERIYYSKGLKMSGVLIYTAVADIVGSLGGIIESADPNLFISLLDGVFKHAQWCSLDPVCTEHKGQGPGWLNRAACHACALIPEPSCDFGNVFLDRIFIKGSKELGIPNLLEYIEEKHSGKETV